VKTIIVPADGASNIKLEVFDFDTLAPVFSRTTDTPTTVVEGLEYNCTEEEFRWFDDAIRGLPPEFRDACVVAPVARGASGGLIGPDNILIEVPGKGLTLAYTQRYPESVEEAFRELAGDPCDFFLETGSIRDLPGSLTLVKRFLFEEMVRPELVGRAEVFGVYGALMSGHFLGGDYLRAARTAGNEHGYWMCHTGARNINGTPGTQSSVAEKIPSFRRLVPGETWPVYRPIGTMPREQADSLGLRGRPLVIPGGHDTCLSHIPVMGTYHRAFGDETGRPVIHLEAGSWTMAACIGGGVELPPGAYERDVVVQGTVDGGPVVTARYGGGNDFRYVGKLMKERGLGFTAEYDEGVLHDVLAAADCFLLPNINPVNHMSGPFPRLRGRITDEREFFGDPLRAFIITNLCTAITTSIQIDAVSRDRGIPVVLTAGGARDPYFGRLLATLTGRRVYALYDSEGGVVSETTDLGAAVTGKAAFLGVHPYSVDMDGFEVEYRELKPLDESLGAKLERYRELFLAEVERHMNG